MNDIYLRRWASVHDIANPTAAGADEPLWLVILDDRGDLGVFVWEVPTMDAAIGVAERHADKHAWKYKEDDVYVLPVFAEDTIAVVLARSTEVSDA